MMVPTITGIMVVLTCYREQDLELLKVYKKSVGVCIFLASLAGFWVQGLIVMHSAGRHV
jgi:hypothetical protein